MRTLPAPRPHTVEPQRSHPLRGFRQLSLTNWRELYRDPKTLFFSMIFPFLFLGMFTLMGFLMDQAGESPVVSVSGPGAASVERSLEQAGIALAPPGTPLGTDANVLVTAGTDSADVLVDVTEPPAKDAVVDAIKDAGISKSATTVLGSDGSAVFDPVRGALPTVLMLGLLSLAFLGTAAPLVGLRQRGTLQLLGTTPLHRSTFILAQTPARFAMGALQVAAISGYAYYLGYLDLGSAGSLMVSCLLGLVMLLSLGYLLASRLTSQEFTTTVASLLIPAALLLSGGMMPAEIIPEGVRAITQVLPTTILSDAIAVDLVGTDPDWGLGLLWLSMAGFTLVAGVAAAGLFRWGQGGKR
jgi:ABC-2 type transport system permease protein